VSSELNRENRSINSPNVLHAVNLQLGIHDTSLVKRQHRKGIRRMELRGDTVGNIRIDLIVGSDSRTRANLVTKNALQRIGSSDLPRKLDAIPQHRPIGSMRQVLWVDSGIVKGAVGGDVQPSLTERVLEGDLDRDRLGAALQVSGGIQQQLDLTDRAQQDVVGVRGVESLIAIDHALVLAGNEGGHGLVEGIKNRLLESGGVGVRTGENCEVGIASCRVDEGEEGRRLSDSGVENDVASGTLSNLRGHGICGGLEVDTRALKAYESARRWVSHGLHTHDVILHVEADTRKIQQHGDTGSSQSILWPNAALHQDIGTSDRSSSQDNLQLDIDGGNGATPDGGKLNTGGSHVAVENDLEDGGVGYNVQVVTRGQTVDVCGTRVRAGPVSRVDGRSGDETSPSLTA
jgi:hypothetical protein